MLEFGTKRSQVQILSPRPVFFLILQGFSQVVIAPHPHKIGKDGRRHYTIRAIPYQDPQQEAERLKLVHAARVKSVPRV